MAGGTQLVEGAFLTGGNTRFCRKSSKCRNYAPFEGDVIKYVLRIILGFGSNEPPSKKESDSNVLPSYFFGSISQITLIYALLSQLRSFWGALWAKIWWWGHKNILMDREQGTDVAGHPYAITCSHLLRIGKTWMSAKSLEKCPTLA